MEDLRLEIEHYAATDIATEWDEFSARVILGEAQKRAVIYPQTAVCNRVIYITEGVTASVYNEAGDRLIISRFFQPGNFCSNLISANSSAVQSDSVVAITKVKYIEFSYDYFMQLYFHSNAIGVFLRKKILDHLIAAKHVISVKTSASTEKHYRFLENHYPEVIRQTPSKYIAAFIGITPEALSRFLKQRHSS
ncbi:MAG: hypothetical protein AAGB22_10660 [Bacteroidota bacterium]